MKLFRSFLREKASEVDKALNPSLRKTIKQKGGKIYQIGGAVRDELVGKISKDLDLLVTGIDMDELQRILSVFGRVDAVGKSFGILKFTPTGAPKDEEPLDISVPRVDVGSTGEGHKDFEVNLGKNISLEQDQLRRDFWMNAIAKDIDTGELHDVDGKGQYDIKNKQIRVINVQAFSDDPLRMLRAIQFAARFEFKIESDTLKKIQQNARKITTVTASRFEEEFKKLFMKAEKPSIGVNLLYTSGIMKVFLPQAKTNLAINSIIDKLDKKAFPVFMTLLLNSYGKTAGQVAFNKFRVSSDTKDSMNAVAEYLMNTNINNFELVEFAMRKKPADLQQIDFYCVASGKKKITDKLTQLKRAGAPLNLKELSVNGSDLLSIGLKGPALGAALTKLLRYAVENKINDKQKLLDFIKK